MKSRARTDEETASRAPTPMKWWRQRRFRWTVRAAVLLGLIGYLTLVGFDKKFYYPDDKVYVRPEELQVAYEDVHFQADDGVRLHGWFLPAAGDAKGLVIHFHGNAANVTGHLALVSWLPDHGYHVLMFDYRGYGESEGRVSREGTIRDGRAAVDYARSRPEARDLPLLAYGQSLGGAVAVVVAAERPEIVAVTVESTFSSYRHIAELHARNLLKLRPLSRFLAWWTISKGYDPLDVVQQLSPRPLLVIAAGNDQICPPVLSEELFAAASEPKEYFVVPGAEHLTILEEDPTGVMDRITAFFDHAVQKSQSSPDESDTPAPPPPPAE